MTMYYEGTINIHDLEGALTAVQNMSSLDGETEEIRCQLVAGLAEELAFQKRDREWRIVATDRMAEDLFRDFEVNQNGWIRKLSNNLDMAADVIRSYTNTDSSKQRFELTPDGVHVYLLETLKDGQQEDGWPSVTILRTGEVRPSK